MVLLRFLTTLYELFQPFAYLAESVNPLAAFNYVACLWENLPGAAFLRHPHSSTLSRIPIGPPEGALALEPALLRLSKLGAGVCWETDEPLSCRSSCGGSVSW